MPRFFFHSKTGDEFDPDDEGQELPDRDSAVREAECGLRELWAEAIKHGTECDIDALVVEGVAGERIAEISIDQLLPARVLKRGQRGREGS